MYQNQFTFENKTHISYHTYNKKRQDIKNRVRDFHIIIFSSALRERER